MINTEKRHLYLSEKRGQTPQTPNSYLQLIYTVLPTVAAKGHMGSDYKQSQPIVLSGNHQEQVLMKRTCKHKNSIRKQQKAFPAILPHCQVGSYYFSNWSCICTTTFNSPWKPFVSHISLFSASVSTHTTRSSAYQKCHIPGSNQAYSNRACTVVWRLSSPYYTPNWRNSFC